MTTTAVTSSNTVSPGAVTAYHRYSYQQLLRAGCPVRRVGESGAEYVERVKTCGALREVEHPGNLVYGWPLTNAGRDALRPAMTYPTLAEYGLPVEP